jgi:multiphosphoryl transfer protein
LDASECRRISQDLLKLSNAAAVRHACHQQWPLS